MAVANTGGNIAIGNSSTTRRDGSQDALNLLGPAVEHRARRGNGSNGSASISTGNASAVGNQSTTNAHAGRQQRGGQLGGILIIDQNAAVLNSGVALANSGGNDAPRQRLRQRRRSSSSGANAERPAWPPTTARPPTTPTARPRSAPATPSAIGNESDTNVMQSGHGSAGGDLGGLVIIEQGALVANAGIGVASTGGNTATGNESFNFNGGGFPPEGAAVVQQNPVDVPVITGVVSNTAEASNTTDGTASINTGNAIAQGNGSSSNVDQTASGDVQGPGALTSQVTSVLNAGFGGADSGGNAAVGNAADDDVSVLQTHEGSLPLFGLSAFQASASNCPTATPRSPRAMRGRSATTPPPTSARGP